jgi:hypothetical protein
MMPHKLGGVAGPDLLVYRIKGLSMVDASIMPLTPGTNLSATVRARAFALHTPTHKRNFLNYYLFNYFLIIYLFNLGIVLLI